MSSFLNADLPEPSRSSLPIKKILGATTGLVFIAIAFFWYRKHMEASALAPVQAAASKVRAALNVGVNYADFRSRVEDLSAALIEAQQLTVDVRDLKPYSIALEKYKDSLDIWNDRIVRSYSYDWPGQYPMLLHEVATRNGISNAELALCTHAEFSAYHCNGSQYLKSYNDVQNELWARAEKDLSH